MDPRDGPSLPQDLGDAVGRALRPGERVVWCAQPRPAAYARKAMPLVFALAAGMAGDVVIFALVVGSWPGEAWLPAAVCLVIGAMQVFVAAAVPIWWYHKAGRTVYLITDRRAILLVRVLRDRVLSFAPAALRQTRTFERGDGSGEIVLSRRAWMALWHSVSWRGTGFVGIDDVARVGKLLSDLAAGGPAPQAAERKGGG
jgi:hypothetical protein